MTAEAPTPRRRNVADVYRGKSSTTKSSAKAATALQPLQPLQPIGDVKERTPRPVKAEPERVKEVARRTARNPHAGRPVLNVRVSKALLADFDRACEREQVTPLELVLTAVAEAVPELPELVAKDNAAKATATQTGAETHSVGGLFELPGRQSDAQRPAATVQRMWRTTQQNMDSIDRIVKQVGAKDRQQLLLLSLTRYLEHKEP